MKFVGHHSENNGQERPPVKVVIETDDNGWDTVESYPTLAGAMMAAKKRVEGRTALRYIGLVFASRYETPQDVRKRLDHEL